MCNGRLICPWHKAEFRLDDGALIEPPALDDLAQYPVSLEGDSVFVTDQPIPKPTPPRTGIGTMAIIGSGAAGTSAAAELRRRGFCGRVLLIGAEARNPYDRTALSKFVMSGDMKPDETPPLRERDWFVQNGIEQIEGTVVRIDATEKAVHLAGGKVISYDNALVALGAVPKHPSLPGMTLAGTQTLRNLADATSILSAAVQDAHVVVMGSSFIGLEAASALRKKGVRVTVVSPDSVPFAKQFGPEIGGMFRRLHEANGVSFRLESEVESIMGTHRVDAVMLKGGEILSADLVLVGVGVMPATEIVKGVDKAHDGGILVDGSFRATAGLYAAGDCATFTLGGERVRIEHWRVAQQQGRIAASSMLGGSDTYAGIPFFWTYHYGHRVEYLGHATDWDSLHIDGDLDSQNFVALQIKGGKVAGVIACQRERLTAILIDRLRDPLPANEAIALLQSA